MSPAECLALLQLPEAASVDQIKAAYRRLAQRLHPDKRRGDAQAQRQFAAISAAYRSLMQAARAVEQNRKVGVCVHCADFGEVVIGLDGRARCTRCIFRPEGGRFLPMPVLDVARCLGTLALLGIALACLIAALRTADPARSFHLSAVALSAGVLGLAGLAWTALRTVHCITDRERRLQHSYRTTEQEAGVWIRRRTKQPPPTDGSH